MERTKQRTKIKESTGERIFTGVIYAILILFCAIIVFPLLHIVSGSFSDPMALLRGEVSFWPKGFTFSMYEKVFKDASIWQGYGNTIVYTVLGTCISVVLTAFAAYPLSRKDFYGRNLFMGVFVFTMFFTGGMIPTFLIVQRLHLLNTMWALILPTAVSTYNLIIMRTFLNPPFPSSWWNPPRWTAATTLSSFPHRAAAFRPHSCGHGAVLRCGAVELLVSGAVVHQRPRPVSPADGAA